MIDHTGCVVTDWQKSRAFYDAALAPLGASMLHVVPKEFTGGAVATQKQTDSTRLTIEDMAKLAEGLNSSVAQFKLA